jgi:predicted Zn-dependent protease
MRGRRAYGGSGMGYGQRRTRMGPQARNGAKSRLIIGLMFAGIAFLSYQCSSEYNPVTGEEQHISITADQEIALGLQAAPEMMAQHGGLHPDQNAQALVDMVGERLVRSSAAGKTDWEFEFHLLRDPQTINAFALPGGQVFITAALFGKLDTEGELAGVLGHEIGHVVARHSAQRMAKQALTQGITGAVLVAAGGGGGEAQMAQMIGNMINMRYGREDELQSDELGVIFMSKAGYDPRSMIRVMEVLDEASGGQAPPEWLSTHPSSGNRVATIQAEIDKVYPAGVPEGMQP